MTMAIIIKRERNVKAYPPHIVAI